jgi:uncharacterized repeat protein (TIGR01451 family)
MSAEIHLSRQQRRARVRAERKRLRRSMASGALFAGALLAAGPAAATNYTVTTLADSGPGSLRQAVLDANAHSGSDQILFQSGLTGTITLTSGELPITDTVTVLGPGASKITISGNNASRIFNIENSMVTAPIQVVLSALTLTSGSANGGGAVRAAGESLIVDSVVISGSTSPTGNGGGLLFSGSNGASLFLYSSTITGNSAPKGSGGGFELQGGDRIELLFSTFSNNQAGYDGGGVDVKVTSTSGYLYADGLLVNGNQAAVNAAHTGLGGGIRISGTSGGKTSHILETTISGNSADPQAASAGGGMALTSISATLDTSTISGNTARMGGGVYLGDAATMLQIGNSTIANNTAPTGSGGGIYLHAGSAGIAQSTITGNSASNGAGGVVVGGGSATLSNAIVANDTTTSGTTPDVSVSGQGSLSAAYSLIKTPGTTAVSGTGIITGLDPQLGPLQSNDTFVTAGFPPAPVLTEMPASTSPAIDSGDPAFVASPGGLPVGDQRGYVRVFGGRIDMGAVEVSPPADLAITESVIGGPTVAAGSAASYKINVQNNGPGDAAAVVVFDHNLQFGTATFSASPSQGTCAGTGTNSVTCNLGPIVNGGAATITVTAAISLKASGAVQNLASVDALQPDSNLTNNSATATITVTPAHARRRAR